MKATLTLRKFDKNYRLLEEREQPSRSWLAGLLRLLYTARNIATNAWNDPVQRYEIATLTIASPGGGGSIVVQHGHNSYTCRDHINSENIGIVIGTGVGAVAPANYALGTQIAHGRGAGQMEYGGCDVAGLIIAHPNGQFTIRRFFENNSGGGITVQEVGIYAGGTDGPGVADAVHSWAFCIARDLTGGVAVLDTELLEATYTVQITV
jgi:hypothetical protein